MDKIEAQYLTERILYLESLLEKTPGLESLVIESTREGKSSSEILQGVKDLIAPIHDFRAGISK